jgi:two-component system, response regulator PdtaR
MIRSAQERRQRADDWLYMTRRRSPAATTILIVEDEFLVRACAADVLCESGFKVLQAANAPDALLVLEDAHVDVVFTDINMPGEFDGLGLARRVRRRWPHVAMVITSGRACPERGVEGARFLPKPYMPETLARLIGEMAGSKRDRRCAQDRPPGRLERDALR